MKVKKMKKFVTERSLLRKTSISFSLPKTWRFHAFFVVKPHCIFGGILPFIRGNGSANCDAVDAREPLAALSGFSRASRVANVSFQRHSPLFPPANSAGKRHKLHFRISFCIEPKANR
jgi:hypothetical protein